MPQDHYTLLGIGRDAAQKDIKQAYRELARELHPDVNPDPAAAERFKQIAQAYEVLSAPARRQAYDARRGNVPQSARAAWAKSFVNQGGVVTNDMLLEALRDNDAETAKIFLRADIIPDEKTLTYAVQNMSSYWVATLLKAGATPTPEMLAHAVEHRKAYTAKILLDHHVPATAAASLLVKELQQPGFEPPSWNELSTTFGESVKLVQDGFKTGKSLLQGIFGSPKAPTP